MKTTNKSYYQTVSIQTSASEGPKKVKVDRALADLIKSKTAGQGDGTISKADALVIANAIADGGKYAGGEKPLARMMMKASDDRFTVKLDGQTIRLTDKAEAGFKHELFSFFGKLGAKAKANNAEIKTAQQALQQFTNQQVG